MKIMHITLLKRAALISLLMSLVVGTASAAIIAGYVSGVSPTAGTTGAADPTSQGWLSSTASPGAFNYGSDSSIGGWRITDGTTASGGNFFYQRALTGPQATSLGSLDWTATWTSGMVGDAVNMSGLPNGVNDYYINNPTLQNNNAIWIESLVGGFIYVLNHTTDANGDVFISDTTTSYQITASGNQLAQEIGTGAPSVNYVTYMLSYDATLGTASLTDSLGGNHGVMNPAAALAPTTDRVVWGATTSGGQGSTVWNGLSLTVIPEPGSGLLLLAGLLGLRVLRHKKRG